MKYAIENTNGQWWTGTCWGVEQARQEYNSLVSLPLDVEDGRMEIFSDCPTVPDIRYYEDEEADSIAVASVRRVG